MRFTNHHRILALGSLIGALLFPASLGATPAHQSVREPLDGPAVPVMVELVELPAALIYASQMEATLNAATATAATQNQIATLVASQQALAPAFTTLATPVLYTTQRVYNGVALLADPAQISALQQLPGVKAVHRLLPKQPDNATSVPFLGAPALWQGAAVPGMLGEGIRVAIIDTGVDYLHVDFGGPGTGYPLNDPTRIGDVPGYPGRRVVGGFDFVGDSYNAEGGSSYQPIPYPDADPMDCYGHGTHVAGTAGGSGVTAIGKTFDGPYDRALDFSALSIGPGVAPAASLYALKVFGCSGSTTVTELALEWAVDPNGDGDFADRMDIVNLSLGSPYGAVYDTTAVAADNAAAAGVIVVASAGNSSDALMNTGTPSVGDRVISVAATQHHRVQAQSSQPGTDRVADFTSRGPRRSDAALKPDLAAPGVSIVSAAAQSGVGRSTLSGTSMAAPHVAGAMALLRQLHPDWSVEEMKALVMNTAMPLVRQGDDLATPAYTPTRIGAGRIDLPAAAQAAAVAFNADSPGAVGVSFGSPAVLATAQLVKNVAIVNKASITATYQLAYNPIADLPGADIQVPSATIIVAPDGSAIFPVTLAVDAAQLRHANVVPTEQARDRSRHWLNEESGHLFFWPGNAPFTATLTGLDAVPPTDIAAQGSVVLMVEPLAHTLHYTVSLRGIDAAGILTATVGLGRPGESSTPQRLLWTSATASGPTITGTLHADAQLERWLVSSALHINLSTAEHPAGALRGQLLATAPVLHLPVYAAPRPVAAMQAASRALAFSATAPAQMIALTGVGIRGSDAPTDVVSLVSAVELHLHSPNTRPAALIDGEQDHYDHADLKYVGVTSDLQATPAKTLTASTLFFGLATYAPWSTPNEVAFSIYIDADQDQIYDYRLFNSDLQGYANRSLRGDTYLSVLENLRTGVRSIQGPLNNAAADRYDSGLLFGSVMVLPLRAGAIWATSTNTAFMYYVETTSVDISEIKSTTVDRTPVLRFDPANPGLDLSGGIQGGPLYADLPGASIPVTLSVFAYAASPAQGVLLLHHHNRTDQQAEVVDIRYTWPFQLNLPAVRR